jgi:two-component system sensor histidine kinase/response regulator
LTYPSKGVVYSPISECRKRSRGDGTGRNAGRAPGPVVNDKRAGVSNVSDLSSDLPGINVMEGLARVARNKKLYLKLLRRVAADAPDIKAKMNAAVMAGDFNALREQAHSIKGSSANLSVIDVSAAAQQLELAAKEEDMAGAVMQLGALESALDAYVAVVADIED